MPDDRRLVYSTDGSLPLPTFGQRPAPRKRPGPPDDGVVRVGCERRRGGSVTLVYGLPAANAEEIGKALRRACGTGGTTKAGIVELQGDHRDRAIAHLIERGLRPKRMGGSG